MLGLVGCTLLSARQDVHLDVYKRQTVAKDLAALSQAFTDAVDSEVIDRNPCTGVSIDVYKRQVSIISLF